MMTTSAFFGGGPFYYLPAFIHLKVSRDWEEEIGTLLKTLVFST